MVTQIRKVEIMEVLELQEQEVVWERPKSVEKLRVRMRLGAKGRLVIPAAMRDALGMAEGDMLDLVADDGELRIATMRERLRRAQESVRKYVPAGVSLADELSAERREAAKNE
jgi:AbrB family looped-hinge helix DNA binding protein